MFQLEDDELLYFRTHLFNPQPVGTPVSLIINNISPAVEIDPVEFNYYYFWINKPNPLSGVM